MKKVKINIISIFCMFIIFQPFFDVFVYCLKELNGINSIIISIIRPLIAVSFYIYFIISNKINNKSKLYSFLYLFVVGLYFILHLLNVKDNFFELSYGSIMNEARQLLNYGYYILQLINVYFIFKISNTGEKRKVILSLVCACAVICTMHAISIATNSSSLTYGNDPVKHGFNGWSISSHHIGHVVLLLLPVVIYSIYINLIKNKIIKFLLLVMMIYSIYMVGTKSPLFGMTAILIFSSLLIIFELIFRKSKINYNKVLIIIATLFVCLTFKSTYGYKNFYNQTEIYNGGIKEETVDLDKYINEEDIIKIINGDYRKKDNFHDNSTKKKNAYDFDENLSMALKKYETPNFSTFDNRTLQLRINKEIQKNSSLQDKLLGYGYYTMINCTWVETDTFAIFFCFGLVGFLLIIMFPLLYFVLSGLKALINYKTLNFNKMLFGFSMCLSIGLITFVGYTLHFAQTVFYFITLLVISDYIFKEGNAKEKEKRKYLFAIYDMSVGGAEVGLVDVINELSKTETVDLVLLRKRGPLLEKLNKNVNVYEILNKDYNKLKIKIFHVLYYMGGIFTKYVYKKTIKYEYDVEVAYIEGYPAVFIANSTNKNSIKIASIRVGLKSHKLNAEKIPFGMIHLESAFNKMDKIYTVSNETTKEFIEKFPKCKSKTSTIYTYFNVEDMKEKAKEKIDFKYDSNCINFLTVGRFNEQKGYIRLIEAFEEVYKKNKNVKLYILGKYETEYGEKVIELIKQKKLDKQIMLCGVKQNPYPYIKNCDCLISSSFYEGYPRVINEALALGKLCIGTNVTGTKEALHDGKMGLLVEDSIKGLVDGMNEVINNRDVVKKYATEINKFDGNKKMFFEFFEKLCTRK